MKEFLSKKLLPALMAIILVVTSFFAVNSGNVNAAAQKNVTTCKTLGNKTLLFNLFNGCTFSGELQYTYHTIENYIVITHITLSVYATEAAVENIQYYTPTLQFTSDDGTKRNINLKYCSGIWGAGPQGTVYTYHRYWDANEEGNAPINIRKKDMSHWTFSVGVSAGCSATFIKMRTYTYKQKLTY